LPAEARECHERRWDLRCPTPFLPCGWRVRCHSRRSVARFRNGSWRIGAGCWRTCRPRRRTGVSRRPCLARPSPGPVRRTTRRDAAESSLSHSGRRGKAISMHGRRASPRKIGTLAPETACITETSHPILPAACSR
jgi:hypothetical protein